MEAEFWWFLEQVLLLGTGMQMAGSSVPLGDCSICFRVHQGKKDFLNLSAKIEPIFKNYLIFIIYSESPVLSICYSKK